MCLGDGEKWEALGNYYSQDFRYLSLKVNKCVPDSSIKPSIQCKNESEI